GAAPPGCRPPPRGSRRRPRAEAEQRHPRSHDPAGVLGRREGMELPARTLDDVFAKHLLPGGQTIAAALPGHLLLESIDGTKPTFVSDTDRFLDAIFP